MNLKNLTFSYKNPINKESSAFILKRPLTHFPVCNIPNYKLSGNTMAMVDYRLRDFPNNKTRGEFNFIKHVSAPFNIEASRANIESYQSSAKIKFEEFLSIDLDTNSNFGYECVPKKEQYSKMFNNTVGEFYINSWNRKDITFEYKSVYRSTPIGYFFIGKGFLGLFVRGEIIPLIMLVIDNEYIKDYQVSNLLDLPIDNSKFEFWINSDFDAVVGNGASYNWVSSALLSKLTNPDKIRVVVKKNMTEYYSKIKTPTFNSISEQLEWINSVKNDFINSYYKPTELLPVKEFITNIPVIEDSIIYSFRNKHLNKFIKQSNEPILYNNYTLIE